MRLGHELRQFGRAAGLLLLVVLVVAALVFIVVELTCWGGVCWSASG